MTDAFRFFLECVNLFFIIYLIGYSSFLFLSVVAGAIELYRSYRLEQMHNKLWQSYYIPVSILVPAYNEEVTVKDTVTSLLNLFVISRNKNGNRYVIALPQFIVHLFKAV